MDLTQDEKNILLEAARQSILSAFGENPPDEVDYEHYPLLEEQEGAFVTLTINDELRGCIGYILSTMTLFETVCDAAMQAAFNDPRFSAVSKNELQFINIEISVLSVPVTISSYEEIIVGKHGILLDESNRAVLLPQVATDHNYDRYQFLTALCEKAGIGSFTWQERELTIKVFSATIFSESSERKS